MKKKIKYLIIFVIFVIFIIGIIFGITIVFNLFNENDDSNSDIRLYRNLIIVSEHNPYVFAVDEAEELTTYTVFKHKDYENYEKIFTVDTWYGWCVGNKKIEWSDSLLYIIGDCGADSYDLSNGNKKELNTEILGDVIGPDTKFLGEKDNFLYFKQNLNNQITYKKVDLDFTQVFLIEEDDVPSTAEFLRD